MEVVREKLLPPMEERRRILEQAGVILAEARALADLLDDQRDLEQTWPDKARWVSFEAQEGWWETPVLERHIVPRFFI
jgi:hypothetical protein